MRTEIIRTHVRPSGRTHFAISNMWTGDGIGCPRCGASHTRSCLRRNNERLPLNEVHIERVAALGLKT